MGPTTSGRRASKPGFLRPVAPTSALPPRPFGLNGFGNLNLGGFVEVVVVVVVVFGVGFGEVLEWVDHTWFEPLTDADNYLDYTFSFLSHHTYFLAHRVLVSV